MLDAVFHRFVDQSPVTVMVGGLLERVLTPEKLDAWFEQTTEKQYTRELLFSTIFDLMSQVVCGIRPSMHAAYQAKVSAMSVSIKSVYNKLNGIEAATSSALVGYSAGLPGSDCYAVGRHAATGYSQLPSQDRRWQLSVGDAASSVRTAGAVFGGSAG